MNNTNKEITGFFTYCPPARQNYVLWGRLVKYFTTLLQVRSCYGFDGRY